MNVSQKCQYAIRAVLELAKCKGKGPTAIGEIASRQAIPPRFLEIILNELKQAGFVESRRGVQGGYLLVGGPGDISVGQIIKFVDGPLDPVKCIAEKGTPCPLKVGCSLIELWKRAKDAVENVYDSCSFQDLMDREQEMSYSKAMDFAI